MTSGSGAAAQLVLRLAAPLQSWGTYRASGRRATTLPVPSKTGVAGLLGACLGTRDVAALVGSFTLDVRVDRTNPFTTDLQTAAGPGVGTATEAQWERAVTVGTTRPAGAQSVLPTRSRTDGRYVVGGGVLHAYTEHDLLPHSEFLVTLTGTVADVAVWYDAVRDPVHMPYLGRRAAAPTFPLVLGTAEAGQLETPELTVGRLDVLSAAPRVRRHDEPRVAGAGVAPASIYRIAGDSSTLPAPDRVTVPVVDTREEYLAWFSRNLRR